MDKRAKSIEIPMDDGVKRINTTFAQAIKTYFEARARVMDPRGVKGSVTSLTLPWSRYAMV